jgi:C4-dicarboxylate-specific signal transduction histidine kinase
MTDTPQSREDIRFFGTVSASVSHEIKNVLAVINEAAGLLEDLALMAERGMPLDPERLKRATATILGQVRRGDGIVRNMNAFAHSADEAGAAPQADLAVALPLAAGLFARLADMRQVTLRLADAPPAMLPVAGFDLMRLLHRAVLAALDAMGKGDTLTLSASAAPQGAHIVLSAPDRTLAAPDDPEFAALASAVDAETYTNDEGALVLALGRSAGNQ